MCTQVPMYSPFPPAISNIYLQLHHSIKKRTLLDKLSPDNHEISGIHPILDPDQQVPCHQMTQWESAQHQKAFQPNLLSMHPKKAPFRELWKYHHRVIVLS